MFSLTKVQIILVNEITKANYCGKFPLELINDIRINIDKLIN